MAFPPSWSLSALDHRTSDFGPGLDKINVLIISSVIFLFGMAIFWMAMEDLITSAQTALSKFFKSLTGISFPMR